MNETSGPGGGDWGVHPMKAMQRRELGEELYFGLVGVCGGMVGALVVLAVFAMIGA